MDGSVAARVQDAGVRRESGVAPSRPGLLDRQPLRHLASFNPWRDPFASDEPWIAYPAIDWLERTLRPGWVGFEYGSGGSTLFFARRVASITAAEHHAGWAERVRRRARDEGLENVRVVYAAPALSARESACRSALRKYRNRNFEAYARTIDAVADGSLDFVFVDGRARVACALRAARKVREGGWLILDNAERERYGPVHAALRRCEAMRFRGFGPRVPWRFETVAWRVGTG